MEFYRIILLISHNITFHGLKVKGRRKLLILDVHLLEIISQLLTKRPTSQEELSIALKRI